MRVREIPIETLWLEARFQPNPEQAQAIRHVEGPLFIAAGPGSGKTSVLLWRTLNLIVYHGVDPDRIFLSTFTEKAARQLRDGLRLLLARVTNNSGVAYDTSRMFVGTAHSLCRRLIVDRRFSPARHRQRAPVLLDELGQYFYLSNRRNWEAFTENLGWGDDAQDFIKDLFRSRSASRHAAVTNTMALFNRLSEEVVEPNDVIDRTEDPVLQDMLRMYGRYEESLINGNEVPRTDFALLQQAALNTLEVSKEGGSVFEYVIIDEYQDTNTIQERLFFGLSSGHQNLCVVGDDDQALYRFRGATVENFVEFPQRCRQYFDLDVENVRRVTLSTNYRSQDDIVDFYTDFIARCDWRREDDPNEQYRVHDKEIRAHHQTGNTAVVASTPGRPEAVCEQVAKLVREIIDEGKVENPNQIAFLFPSLKSVQVGRMREALEEVGLQVYAPRAGRFLEVPEANDIFGVYLHIFGRPKRGNFRGRDYADYHDWVDTALARGAELISADPQMRDFVALRRGEIGEVKADYGALLKVVERNHWDPYQAYQIDSMKRRLFEAHGLSDRAKRIIASARFERIARLREREGNPYDLRYIITRATSLDWTVLEIFYQLCGFEHFRAMFDLAENGIDEGPICNLGLVTQYLARFMDEYVRIITARVLDEEGFVRLFFARYLYALFRLGESEYEDADDPFPKGRIPFLTIHQAKGLEFPVVVLGNPLKKNQGPQRVETLVRPLLDRGGEPLDRLSVFDIMRLFYVALSRAKNLLIIPHYQSQGNYINSQFKEILDADFPRIPDFDVANLPTARLAEDAPPKNYSYTGDYLLYQRCPREYMIFRKYGLFPATTQTRFFGQLVHQTLEDLHQYLIARREEANV